MKRNEMIEILMGKANVIHEEVEEALEKCNWDLLDSIIYLGRNHKGEPYFSIQDSGIGIECEDILRKEFFKIKVIIIMKHR